MRGTGKREPKNASAANGNWLTATVKNKGAGMRYRDSHDLRSGTPTRGLLPRKLYLKKHMHPNLMAALIPRDRIWSNQQGNRHRPGQQGVAHTPGKGTSHPRRRKECPQQRHGRTQGGAQEASQSDRGRPIAHVPLPGGSSKRTHISSLRKETPTHTLKTHLVFRLEKPQTGIHQELGSSQTHSQI